jgi:hypothetical protein
MAATVATAEPADRESGQAGESVAAVTPFHKKKREQKYGCRDNGHKGSNAALTPRLTGRLPISAGSTGSGARRLIPAPSPALSMAGKLRPRGWISAGTPGSLVHIMDESSHRRFLVDTGAAYSIFPISSSGKQSGPPLTGADGLHIPCWGERPLSLVFHGRRFEWPFLPAKVQFPIIGVDFLRHFKLLDPCSQPVLWTSSPHSFSRSQLDPAAAAATAASTSSGRVVQLQAEAQKPAPAPLTDCSQSGQPTRAVTAVAADLAVPSLSLYR